MKKLLAWSAAIVVGIFALTVPALGTGGGGERPTCPDGYTEAEYSETQNETVDTDRKWKHRKHTKVLLCVKETIKEVEVVKTVVKTVPGPERIVEKEVFGTPVCVEGTTPKAPAANGAIVCIERVDVPGPERVRTVTKTKTKVKIVKVKGKTRIVHKTKLVKFCPKPRNPEKLTG